MQHASNLQRQQDILLQLHRLRLQNPAIMQHLQAVLSPQFYSLLDQSLHTVLQQARSTPPYPASAPMAAMPNNGTAPMQQQQQQQAPPQAPLPLPAPVAAAPAAPASTKPARRVRDNQTLAAAQTGAGAPPAAQGPSAGGAMGGQALAGAPPAAAQHPRPPEGGATSSLEAAKQQLKVGGWGRAEHAAPRERPPCLHSESWGGPLHWLMLTPTPPPPRPRPALPPRPRPRPRPSCISQMRRWWECLPESDYRLAALRPGGDQNVIWTPHATDFLPGNPKRPATIRCVRRHPRLLRCRRCCAAAAPPMPPPMPPPMLLACGCWDGHCCGLGAGSPS